MDAADCRQLTFTLNGGDYGFPIHTVNEVIGIMDITIIPKAPKYIKGIINLRGKIIPVMDLRLNFGMPEITYDARTCIIIISVNLNGEKRTLGVAVDKISEVVDIDPNQIEPPPQFGLKQEDSFIDGIGKVKERVIMLLNIDKVVDGKEIALFFKNEPKKSLETV